MQWLEQIFLGSLLLSAMPLWSQGDNTAAVQPRFGTLDQARIDDVMLTPAPVGGQFYPTQVTSEERSNYLRAGLVVTGAYTDNVLGSATAQPVSDESYTVGPTLTLDQTRSRLHLVMTYAPGFTFYQHTSSRNESDQNAAIDVTYRLSPHVTVSGRDGFVKSSNVFDQLTFTPAVSGAAQQPNFSVIAPIASILSNSGNVEIAYQFELAGWLGVLYPPSLENALHRRNLPVSKVDIVSNRRPERNPNACGSSLLHALCFTKIIIFFLWRSPTFRNGRAWGWNSISCSAFVDSGGGGQLELAGPVEQLCDELLARDFRWRGVDRCSRHQQRQRVNPPTVQRKAERDRSRRLRAE
jgi:hypothetical protein